MIYRNIEKLVLNTPNNMELGEKLRELYWRERDEFEKEIGWQGFDNTTIDDESGLDEFEKLVDGLLGLEKSNGVGMYIDEDEWIEEMKLSSRGNVLVDQSDKPLTPPIKGSYKDELPPSDYQLDN
tara:strand:+ start:991 stop:1365 length:375 start_codon:yes stop_codon:yes gene_type:complete